LVDVCEPLRLKFKVFERWENMNVDPAQTIYFNNEAFIKTVLLGIKKPLNERPFVWRREATEQSL
jgi:hypothetical protein